jgi:uncharacterized membrane protein
MKNTHDAQTNWDAVAYHVDENVTAIECEQRYNKKRLCTVDDGKEKVTKDDMVNSKMITLMLMLMLMLMIIFTIMMMMMMMMMMLIIMML